MGGMTQYLDLPSWVAGEMIWALAPVGVVGAAAHDAARREPAAGAGRSATCWSRVGYVFGTIMLIVVLAGLPARLPARPRPARPSLPVLGAGVAARPGRGHRLPARGADGLGDRPRGGLPASAASSPPTRWRCSPAVLPTAAVPGTADHLLPYAYLVVVPARGSRGSTGAGCARGLAAARRAAAVHRRHAGHRRRAGPGRAAAVAAPAPAVPRRGRGRAGSWWPGPRSGSRRPSPRRLAMSLAWVALAGLLSVHLGRSMWRAHLCSRSLVVAAGLVVLWWLVRAGRPARAGARGRSSSRWPCWPSSTGSTPTLPRRSANAPTDLAAYQAPLAGRGRRRVAGRRADDLLVQQRPGRRPGSC